MFANIPSRRVFLILFLSLLFIVSACSDDNDCPTCPQVLDDDTSDDDVVIDDDMIADDDTVDDDTIDDDVVDDDAVDDDTVDDDAVDDDTVDDDAVDDDAVDDDAVDDDAVDDDAVDDDAVDDDAVDDDAVDDDATDDDTTLHEPEGVPVSGLVQVNDEDVDSFFSGYDQVDTYVKLYSSEGDEYLANVDSDSSYRMPYVPAGTYDVELEITVLSDNYNFHYRNSFIIEDLVVAASDTVQDIDLTLYEVGGVVTDPIGDPVNGINLAVERGSNDAEAPVAWEVSTDISVVANSYSIYLPAYSNYTFTWTPPVSTSLPRAIETNVSVTTDLTYNYQFSATANQVAVNIESQGNDIRFRIGSGTNGWMTFTNGDDIYYAELTYGQSHFDIVLPDGTYDIVYYLRASAYSYFQYTEYYDDTRQITVDSSNTDFDFDLDLKLVQGTITDPDSTPLESVYVEARYGEFPPDGGKAGIAFRAYIDTDEDGDYALYLPAATYSFSYDPVYLAPEDYAAEVEMGVVISDDATHDYQFHLTPATFNGSLTINDQLPLTFFSTIVFFGEITLVDELGNEFYGEISPNGSFEVLAMAGRDYTVDIGFDVLLGMTGYVFFGDEEFDTITLSANKLSKDYDLAMHHLSGNVYLSDGETPATGTEVMASNQYLAISDDKMSEQAIMFGITMVIDILGSYNMPVLEGVNHLSFLSLTEHMEYLNNIDVTDDMELDFVFLWDGEETR